MRAKIDDVPCPKCGQQSLEYISRKRDGSGVTISIVCACGHEPNLYDIGGEQFKKAIEAEKKGGG